MNLYIKDFDKIKVSKTKKYCLSISLYNKAINNIFVVLITLLKPLFLFHFHYKTLQIVSQVLSILLFNLNNKNKR